MNGPVPAKLVVIGGALAGDVFTLAVERTTLGRDSLNTIAIPDAALSRSHCTFTWDVSGWTVTDLSSSNGTFVNGVQVKSHALVNGDRVSVGSSVLLFAAAGTATEEVPASFDEGAALPETLSLVPDQAAYLRPSQSISLQPNVERGLRALLTISTVISAISDEDRLHRELLDLVFDTVPAEEGAIVLSDSGQEFRVAVVRPVRIDRAVHVSTATVRRVMEKGVAILCAGSDALQIDDARSPRVGSPGASVMVVPIAVQKRSLGAIYLTARLGTAFTPDHLELVTAIGRISAVAIPNVRRLAALERDADQLQVALQLAHHMIGDSAPVRQVYELVAKVARVDTTALITGETGTGKELAARAIHLNSSRAKRPFIAINCAALTEPLLESELFGHERGAFTSAVSQKKGKLEVAHGGTVLLDEVGELAPSLQSKLLRVLQEREFERVGGTQSIKVDIRILAATNRNLVAEVAAGRFRQDLYFRLNVVSIELPPLRERRDDVLLLARHFVSVYSRKVGRHVDTISPIAARALVSYDWPGNVRELENAIERAIVIGSSGDILLEDLPDTVAEAVTRTRSSSGDDLHARVHEAKRKAVVDAFRAAGGSYTAAARLLGVHPNYLHRLIRNLEIKTTLEQTGA